MFQRASQTAKFLTTTGVSYELEKIVSGATVQLVLISPFLSVNQRIQDMLADKARMNLDIRVVYGKSELSPTQHDWLSSMPSIRTTYCADLHAKCYLNEKSALITSMNLYEFSQVNNIEMGILVHRDSNETLYKDINAEVLRILRTSQERRLDTSSATAKGAYEKRMPGRKSKTTNRSGDTRPGNRRKSDKSDKAPPRRRAVKPKNGFCIRCRGELPADPLKPYCGKCHKAWSRYKNYDYEDKHCHLCGDDHVTTLKRPVCKPCYTKNKKHFQFSSGNT